MYPYMVVFTGASSEAVGVSNCLKVLSCGSGSGHILKMAYTDTHLPHVNFEC